MFVSIVEFDGMEIKTETNVEENSEIPNAQEDWKLCSNVDSRIILEKLKIKTPEYRTTESCRDLEEDLRISTNLRNRSVQSEPPFSATDDMCFKSEFLLDVLMNEILGKCKDNCELCDEFIHQLRHHIIQTHGGGRIYANTHSGTVFKCDICNKIFSSPLKLIRHQKTHSDNLDVEDTPTQRAGNFANHESSFNITPTQFGISDSDNISPLIFLKQESAFLQTTNVEEDPMSTITGIPPSIPEHVNHFLTTIEKNLKYETDDIECEAQDPLLNPEEVSHYVKYECKEVSTQIVDPSVTYEKSSVDRLTQSSKEIDKRHTLNSQRMAHTKKKPHKCETCGKCFAQAGYLTLHQVTHTGVKPHKCNLCGKCFGRMTELTSHIFSHTGEKPHKCDTCGKCFAHAGKLTVHKVTHTGDKPHKCDSCGKCFPQNYMLTQHKLTHGGDKLYGCDICGKCFARRDGLTQHKVIHTGEKPWKCDTCGKCFTREWVLTQHKHTPTGEKPFKCDENGCDKSFTQRNSLTIHKLTHTGETPHKCNICGKCFIRKSILTQHITTHT